MGVKSLFFTNTLSGLYKWHLFSVLNDHILINSRLKI